MSNTKKVLPCERGTNLIPPDKTTYTYFEDCENHPFRCASKKFELVNAWWLADAAFLAYADEVFIKRNLSRAGLPGFRFFSVNSTQCFVGHNDNFVIVAFRGTELKRLNSIEDIWTDFHFNLVESGQGGKVHKGFKEALDEIWDKGNKLNSYLKGLKSENPRRKFWFTGHSLGAALATLAADRFGYVQGLYTYGSPKVGDIDFKNDFYVNTYRFVNNNDIVPHLPPHDLLHLLPTSLYQHVGAFKYIDTDGEIEDNPPCWNSLADGFMGKFEHFFNSLGNIREGYLYDIPVDELTDHAPIFYSIHIWNNYIQERAPMANP